MMHQLLFDIAVIGTANQDEADSQLREKDFPRGISVIKSEEHRRASSIERETFMTRNGASKRGISAILKKCLSQKHQRRDCNKRR